MLRKKKAELNLSLQKAKAKRNQLISRERQELKGLSIERYKDVKSKLERQKKELNDRISELASEHKKLNKELDNLSESFLDHLDPVKQVQQLSDTHPILMFPLRLEVRFKSTGDQPQLWLRVFPDDCNINAKEELLSESALSNAKDFWIEMWKAGRIESEERSAWKRLVNSHGSGRAAWIIEQFMPDNADQRPAKPNKDHKILLVVNPSLSLSDAELQAAKSFWSATWLAQGKKKLKDEAYERLKSDLGEQIAQQIIKQFVPVNISEELPGDITEEQILLETLHLPSDEEFATTETSWNRAPEAVALPDRFAAVLYSGEEKRTALFDRRVKENLAVGPDPSLEADEQIKKDENRDLQVNEALKWMVDFDEAVAAGMGVKINLTPEEASLGFDKLFVTGLRLSSDEIDSKSVVENLLQDHLYSKNGFGFLRQGTPVKNTEEEKSGFSWLDDPDKSYDRIFKKSETFDDKEKLFEKSDGQKFADLIGIDPDILKNVPNANGRDQLEANAMNRALFPATLGYFMEEMMHPLFRDQDIDATKLFFSHFVSGRGPLPAFRIARQPYGILPVSVFSRLRFYEGNRFAVVHGLGHGRDPYLTRLHTLLSKMDDKWEELLPEVPYLGKDGDPHQILLDVIGLHAHSAQFHQRYAQSLQQVFNQLLVQFGFLSGIKIAQALSERGHSILSGLGIDPDEVDLPILEKFFLSEPNLLSGPFIDDVPESETDPIRPYTEDGEKNYIEWLISSDAEVIRAENFGGAPGPDALLYLLLRHALMQSQADAAAQMLQKNELIQSKKELFDPDFIHVQQEGGGRSKFDYLYANYPSIPGAENIKLVDHIYKPDVLQEQAETRRLKDNLDALSVLKKTPTARLERLLTEHLDCCNYRLDAWKTGLVSYKLMEQRWMNREDNKPSKGLYLGAYGWLLDVRPEQKELEEVTLSEELNEVFNKGNSTKLKRDSSNLGYIHAPSLNQAATAAILRNAYDSNRDSGTDNQFAINITSDRVRMALRFLEGMRNGQSLSSLLGYQFERGLRDTQIEIDRFIYPLRKAFPLVADNMEDTKSGPSDSIETIEANNVIDGLKLINHVQEQSSFQYPFGVSAEYDLPAADATEADAINSQVQQLIHTHDAISDLIVSEEIYQAVQGNYERASGNAEAFSKGSYPPDIDVVKTPRSGVTLTQRLAIQFDTDADPGASPNSIDDMTPRATAEPGINKWLSGIFPDPEKVLCKVSYTTPGLSEEITELISQKDLKLQPVDLLYCFDLETDQAMTELDDRISYHVRYSISQHPNTKVKIHYTELIDKDDRTKVSFFEMASMVRSLRKLLIGTKHLKPSEVNLPAEEGEQNNALDDAQLKVRVEAAKAGLNTIKSNLSLLRSETVSIMGLTESFESALELHVSETSRKEALSGQLKQDLKIYLTDPSSGSKDEILSAFEESIGFIADSTVAESLKDDYETGLDEYVSDFPNLDKLISDTARILGHIAFYNNSQTGSGFIHDAVSEVYESVFFKLDRVTERWEQKIEQFNTTIAGYDPAGEKEEQLEILRKAERVITTKPTFPLPDNLDDYKDSIDDTKASMDEILDDLKSLRSTSEDKLTDFISVAESHIAKIARHDIAYFDPEKERNDLKSEKLKLILLKEDIVKALRNVEKFMTENISSAQEELALADDTDDNSDKVNHLQHAAKHIFGQEALLLPHFRLSQTQRNEIENSYNSSQDLLKFLKEEIKQEDQVLLPVDEWLGSVSRVRQKAHHWENVTFLAGAFTPDNSLDITPLQFPYRQKDRWLAMKFRSDEEDKKDFLIDEDKLLYTAHYAVPFDGTKAQCGIVMDEWTEVIPTEDETTGVAFHYDQPNSEPPQTMLLVTPPEFTGSWKWEDIIDSMEETLQMVKKRAVEPSMIEKTHYAQFLPTTMMAVTLHWITVATNLAVNNKAHQKSESE